MDPDRPPTGATWAIVPVKALSEAKGRLTPLLPVAARRELVLAMLTDVLGKLQETGGFARIVVVTTDPAVAACAVAADVAVLRETGARGLNAAVSDGLVHAAAHGAARALVLPADVPFATVAELRILLADSPSAQTAGAVTIAPSADGAGTNALLLSPPDVLEPSFGPGSYVEHLSQAVARRLDVRVAHLAGLAADIDEPADVMKLSADAATATRYAFLKDCLPAADHGPGLPPE